MKLLTSNGNTTLVEDELIEDIPFEVVDIEPLSTSKPFIEANTSASTLAEIQDSHIIPVYVKDNEPVISHAEFIETTSQCISQMYYGEHILKPSIRVSHPIKGRVPEARNKPANDLQEHEKTIYYERMAFVIEIPSISSVIDGNTLHLVAGGVKAYNLDNLHSKKGTEEHFKVFIGYQNVVCCNLKVWTDGFISDLKVTNIAQLREGMMNLLQNYNASTHLREMQQLTNYSLTEQEFAQLIGRCRMYPHLPKGMQTNISPLLFGDTQLGTVCKDYYRDKSFCRDSEGNINLWRLYNLFTGANKSTYIDSFLDRSVNAFNFVSEIRKGLEYRGSNWFLN